MKKLVSYLYILLAILLVTACSSINDNNTTQSMSDKTTYEKILANNQDADIFLYQGNVYKNAEAINWVKELDLSLGKEIGEINNSNKATKLPVGTTLYEPVEKKGSILIAIVGGKEVRYLQLNEG